MGGWGAEREAPLRKNVCSSNCSSVASNWVSGMACQSPEFNNILSSNAYSPFSSMPHTLLAASGHVIAVLAGWPTGTFEDVLLQATSEFNRLSIALAPGGESEQVLPDRKQYTRGHFHAIISGISYGGGQCVHCTGCVSHLLISMFIHSQVPMNSVIPRMY